MSKKNENKHKFWDFRCECCGKKFLISKLEEDGFVDTVKFGKVVFCPLCSGQTLVEER